MDDVAKIADRLDRLSRACDSVTVGDVVDCGIEAIDAMGWNPWLLREGLAQRDDAANLGEKVRDIADAIRALSQEQGNG